MPLRHLSLTLRWVLRLSLVFRMLFCLMPSGPSGLPSVSYWVSPYLSTATGSSASCSWDYLQCQPVEQTVLGPLDPVGLIPDAPSLPHSALNLCLCHMLKHIALLWLQRISLADDNYFHVTFRCLRESQLKSFLPAFLKVSLYLNFSL